MKVAAQEVFARKAVLNDSSTDDDTRDRGPHFEAALAKLRQERAAASTDHEGSGELGGSQTGDTAHDRRRRMDHLDADGLTEDQVLSATANNPVLAALAAARGPWQTVYGSGRGAPVDGSGRGAPVDGSGGGAPVASNVRRIDEALTRPHVDAGAVAATNTSAAPIPTATEGKASDAGSVLFEHGVAISAEAETALIAAQNAPVSPVLAATESVPSQAAPGANVPTLPPAVAQRMVDGTVAALRIDRDTANPQHSASIIEVRHPELGVVRAEVRLHGDAMEVRFEATGAAALLLRASESELRKAVGQHGLRLRNLQIDSRSTLLQERSRRARRHLLDLEA